MSEPPLTNELELDVVLPPIDEFSDPEEIGSLDYSVFPRKQAVIFCTYPRTKIFKFVSFVSFKILLTSGNESRTTVSC